MKLSFLAKDDLMVIEPDTAQFAGQTARYINRQWDEEKHGFPAIREPFSCDSDSRDGRRMVKLLRRDNSLLPADAATAAFCGVKFVPHFFHDGTWIPGTDGPENGDA